MSKKLLLTVALAASAFFMGLKVFSEDVGFTQSTHAPDASHAQSVQGQTSSASEAQEALPGDELGSPQSRLGIEGVAAFVIQNVTPGSPAEQAGLKIGDLVTWVDGKPVNSLTDVLKISRKPAGQRVELFVLRHNPDKHQRDPVTVTVTTAPLK